MSIKSRISQLFLISVGFLLFSFLLISPALTQAAIRVSTLRVDFSADGNRYQDVFVQNMGDEIAYINISLFKRTDPAHDVNKIISDEGGDPKLFGLVATPSKMALDPGQTKRIRLLNLTNGQNQTDLVYGLSVLPVAPPIERAPSAANLNNAGQVTIISAYIIGVYILPKNPVVNLNLKRAGNILTISNTGNTNAFLDQCTQAPSTPVSAKTNNTCPDLRIYGQSSKTITLPAAAPVSYRASYLNGFYNLKSN